MLNRVSLLLIAASACAPSVPPEPVPRDVAGAIGLTATNTPAELAIPNDNRGGALPPSDVRLDGPWTLTASRDGMAVWQAALPIRPRTLFFHAPPPGMVVMDADGQAVPYGRGATGSWTFDRTHIRVRIPSGSPPEGWQIRFPPATVRESRLNYGFSGEESPTRFAFTQVQDGYMSYGGVLLPAPGRVAWNLTLPQSAELRMNAGLVPPEIQDGPASDGVTAFVEITPDGAMQSERVARIRLGEGIEPVRIPLTKWSGQAARLTIRTEPGGSDRADYAFFADAAVTSNQQNPQRIVMVFIDTLRPDHLSFNGYERDTSPTIDALTRQAVVFDQARSVAPWTLPTARAVTTGRHPEVYDVAQTLQSRFRDAGWATGMFAGNVFLSANFAMNRDWGVHRVSNWPPAEEQVDHALSWLQDQDGRDALLMVHFMDAHLPYLEPDAYRRRFAGDAPESLGEAFHRSQVLRADQADPEIRAFIEGRYDNNIRYIDDELARLLSALDDDDIVVLFSDHGEEFWDHGGFEHGHTLYDELLRVPLVIRAEGATGRVTEPVSLLDLSPTILDLADLPFEGLDGISLLPALRGDAGARQTLMERDQAIGRPLYGDISWGVIDGPNKWTSTRGRDRLVNVLADPDESVNQLVRDPGLGRTYPSKLGKALGTYVPQVLRVTATGTRDAATHDLTALITVPGGIEAAWVADDPTGNSQASVREQDGVARVTWRRGRRATREVYILPSEPIADVLADLVADVSYGDAREVVPAVVPNDESLRTGGHVLWGRVGGRAFGVNLAHVPLPFADGVPLDATDPELSAALQAMGYAVGTDEPTDMDSDSTR